MKGKVKNSFLKAIRKIMRKENERLESNINDLTDYQTIYFSHNFIELTNLINNLRFEVSKLSDQNTKLMRMLDPDKTSLNDREKKEEIPTIKVGDKELSVVDDITKLSAKEVRLAIIELLKSVYDIDGNTDEEQMELISNITSIIPCTDEDGAKYYKIYVDSKYRLKFKAEKYDYVADLNDGILEPVSSENE